MRGLPDIDAHPPTQSKSTLPQDGLGAGSVAFGGAVPSLDRPTHRDSTERGSPVGARGIDSLATSYPLATFSSSVLCPRFAASKRVNQLVNQASPKRKTRTVAGLPRYMTDALQSYRLGLGHSLAARVNASWLTPPNRVNHGVNLSGKGPVPVLNATCLTPPNLVKRGVK